MSADRPWPAASPPPSPPPSPGRLPGPRSRFPFDIPLRMSRDILGFLAQAQQQFGDVVHYRVAKSPFYLLTHPDAVRDVLVTHNDAFMKGPALRRARPVLGDGLLTSEGDLHRSQRRLIQPVLHPARVATYATMMTDYAHRLSSQWGDGHRVDLHQQMMSLTLQVVAKALFGAEVESELESIGQAMDITVKMFTRAMSPFGRVLDRLPLPSNFRFRRAHGRLLQTVEGFIRRSRERQSSSASASISHSDVTASPSVAAENLLTRLLEARDAEAMPDKAGSAMTDAQVRDECLTLFTAGHETTANALTFTWILLARHPDVHATLCRELDDVLAGRIPTMADVERLVYTRAVISESMRLYPPAWALGRETPRAVTIAGTALPPNAVVLLSQWVVHRDARWWPDPLRFDPARWLEPAPQRPRWSYFPFGGGSRSCIGEAFAWTEAILLLATLAQRWRVELESASLPALLPTITLRPRDAVWARLRER